MSYYSSFLKNEIGYASLDRTTFSDIGHCRDENILFGDPTVSVATDPRSLGQVVVLDGDNNVSSDRLSSYELHKKSKEALSQLFK